MGLFSVPRAVDTVRPSDYDTLEEIHAASFIAPWSADEQASLNEGPGVTTFVARRVGATSSRRPIGFITVRQAADEGEILTMAVARRQRRSGVGRLLLNAALRHLYAERVTAVFLEVDPSNAAAVNLYAGAGFSVVGERPDYYGSAGGARQKALTMRLTFKQPEFAGLPLGASASCR
ncbi:GNAT family N-acetyltransferase [Acuticoccus sp. I52.16.1]|uniref:GNAT family N-acetyltransferase n=1 Tax=Acuticoccus sp. I52.16.1 TaxID=2928472 RepID=UPI001FD6010C|nr:GNAT family N-acetyltransferase [Acuticoccus sp. I52.16.1]UOM36956.1 GNAT family N-acetyltransferase [Acuticoccus sp. I52.16.1]